MEPRSLLHRSSLGLLVVVLIITSNGCCVAWFTGNTDINKKLTNIASKVDAIDAKLTSLSGGQDKDSLLTRIDQKLESIDQKLDVLAQQNGTIATAEILGNTNGEQETGRKNEQEEFPYYNCVNLISVERNPTSDGNRFTVKFTKNAEDVICHYAEGMDQQKVTETIVAGDNGVWSVSFTSAQSQGQVWISMHDRVEEEKSFYDTRHGVYLQLDNSELTTSFQQVGDLPEIHVDPPRAAVYVPGQDFNVTAFVPHINTSGHDSFIFESFNGINITSGKAYMGLSGEKLFQKLNDNSDPSKKVSSITVLTSSSTLSGYLSFHFGFGIGGPLAKRIQVNRLIAVRPSNQSAVLPAGFLGFFNNPRLGLSQNGNELQQCKAERKCTIRCLVVGDSISDIEVLKVLPDGRKEAVPSATSADLDLDHLKGMKWKFQAEEDSEDDRGITTFQCSASDMSHGKEVSKFIDVLVVIDSGFDEESSNVTVRDDYMHTYIKIITFNCAVYGRPLPEVTFSGGTSPIFSFDSSEPDDIVNTGQNKAVATKTLTLDVDYYNNHGYRIYEDGVAPYCGFFSSLKGDFVTHSFEIPNIGLQREGDRESME
ncbi:hypothetical protein RRG08_029623 [Elysia crispata]|uniref:Uncharacterized protein n=1 Tax=Elysia crispata TaxID=231223 RepID=A0AAE1CJR0_9GAST|nr:hypothetical protein RRG08_029623 [Elysia crispata]